jgi:hypothetical protein
MSDEKQPSETFDCPVWGNRFNWCALAAGFLAAAEGRIEDSRYVQKLAYELFETGAFRDRVPSGSQSSAQSTGS